jgi:uncharacterized protein
VRRTLGIIERPVDVDLLAAWFGTAPWEPWSAEEAAEHFLQVLQHLTAV